MPQQPNPFATGRRWRPTARRLCAIVIVLGIAARVVRYALCFPLWGDEAFVAVNFLSRGFRGMIAPLLYGQIVPLGYMWATLAVTRVLGLSEYALRLVSLAGGILGLLVLWRFAARYFGRWTALTAVGFLAAAYYPIRHANEVKAYSTDLCLSALLIYLAWAVYERPRSVGRWTALILFTGAAVWCSFPIVFVAGGAGILLAGGLGRDRSKTALCGLVVYGAVLGGSFLLMEHGYARPHAAAAAGIAEIDMWTRTWPPLDRPARIPLWLLLTHTGNMLAYPVGGKNGGSSATFVLAVVGTVAVWRSRRRAMLWLLLGPLPLNLVAAVLHRYPYGGTARVSLYLAPAFCLLAGVGLATLVRMLAPAEQRRHAFAAVAAVFMLVAGGSIVRDVIEPYKKSANMEARRVVRWLGDQARREDQVVVFNATRPEASYAPFIAPWRGDGAQFIYYLTRCVRAEMAWAPPPEDVRPRDNATVWLVVYAGDEFRRKHDAYRDQKPDYAATHAPFDELLSDYLDTINRRLGQSRKHSFPLQIRDGVAIQQIDVYQFGGPDVGV